MNTPIERLQTALETLGLKAVEATAGKLTGASVEERAELCGLSR